MAWIKEDLRKVITENNIKDVLFQDPLTDVTRKAKRNLVAGSFACLLIATLNLQVTTFSGLQASVGVIGNEITKGLACIVVVYMLITFMFHFFVDYSAWNFERERFLTQPYLDLIDTIVNHLQITPEQIRNASRPLKEALDSQPPSSGVDFSKIGRELNQTIESLNTTITELTNEVSPLLESWRNTIGSTERLSTRFRVRLWGLWILDLLIPIALSSIAIWRSWAGVHHFAGKIWS